MPTRRFSLAVLAGALLLAFAPLALNDYWLRIVANVYMFAVLAQGINLMAGYTGYPAFGNVVFFGLGGYTAALAMLKLGLPFAAAATVGTLACPLPQPQSQTASRVGVTRASHSNSSGG